MKIPKLANLTDKVLISGFVAMVAIAGFRTYARHHLAPATNTDSGVLSQISTKLGVQRPALTKSEIAGALAYSTALSQFPTEISLPGEEGQAPSKAVVEYAFDAKLQEVIEAAYRKTTPDYGAFVALDATTGRILSMVSYSHDPTERENLALRATFPSASVFKVVTAAAAISEDKFSPNTVIPYTGQNHTLYKTNVFHQGSNRWTRYVSLKEAFAKSINTVFGKIGAYNLQPSVLRDYADRFGFNRKIASDVPVQAGRAPIPDDPWGVAQASSGYTRDNTMSPLQGSLIAATVVNNGIMMEPYLVASVYQPDGTKLYTAQPTVSRQVITPDTAMEIRALMRETVSHGTCQKTFHGFSRSECALIDVGGKTGTLTGFNPLGKYDWFIGYAEYGGQKLAFASLTIHKDVWRVKSSQIAREAIETYFKDKLPVSEHLAAMTLHHRRHHTKL
jgi:penicillin-binding protein A